jgi:hypothetical protein
VFVIPDAWNYPYPRQRGLVFGITLDEPLTPAEEMYSLRSALEFPRPVADTGLRTRTMTWARAPRAAAEREPARSVIREAVLRPDWAELGNVPSRLRGTYRVTVEGGDVRGTWFFRTYDRRQYSWREAENARSTANVLESPHAAGYQMEGFAAFTRDALPEVHLRNSRGPDAPYVWLAATDRPTVAGNDAQRTFTGSLEFALRGAPASLWDYLEALVPPPTALEIALHGRGINLTQPRGDRQSRIPLTIRMDDKGGVHADTVLTKNGQRMRFSLDRVDTVSVKWPW